MRAINKLIATTVFLIAFIFLGFHICQSHNNQASAKEIKSNINEVVLRIEGMTCKACPLTIKTALKKLNGIVDVEVRYEDKEAKVTYHDKKVTTDQMAKAIEKAGNYSVEIGK